MLEKERESNREKVTERGIVRGFLYFQSFLLTLPKSKMVFYFTNLECK